MHKNVTFSSGNIALIDKTDSETRFFQISPWTHQWTE